jgi:hypothetical protein
MSPKAHMQSLALSGSAPFVPVFVWFERLTQLVLREYVYRVIAPLCERGRDNTATITFGKN